MKTLTDYTKDAYTKLWKDTGAFFAFSDEQFNESKVEGVTYVNASYGLYCPKENVTQVQDGMISIVADGVKQDLTENGISAIIKRELWNHEAFYTGDIDDTLLSLKAYGITSEQVMEVFNKESKTDAVINSL